MSKTLKLAVIKLDGHATVVIESVRSTTGRIWQTALKEISDKPPAGIGWEWIKGAGMVFQVLPGAKVEMVDRHTVDLGHYTAMTFNGDKRRATASSNKPQTNTQGEQLWVSPT